MNIIILTLQIPLSKCIIIHNNTENKRNGGMNMMDIAALSSGLSYAEVNSDIGIAVLKNSLELIDDMGEGMIKIMESSVNPDLGQNVDLYI